MCQKPRFVDGQLRTCHKCHECRQHDSNEWYVRIYHEIRCHATKAHSFITLTYDPDHYPDDGCGRRDHLVDFIKRLRDRLRYPEYLKYFATSEYGKKNGRIHYHILLLNLDLDFVDFAHKKKLRNFRKLIKDTWNQGRVNVEPLDDKAIRYVVDYISSDDKLVSEKFGYSKEFRIMSKFIGFDWIDNPDNQKFVEMNNFIVINGHKYSVPRYYTRKLLERKSLVEEETAKIDSRIAFLDRLRNHDYFYQDVDLVEYKRLVLERKELELFCRDKEIETELKKLKRRLKYYYRKIYPLDFVSADSQPLQSVFYQACDFLAETDDVVSYNSAVADYYNLVHEYDRHKQEYRKIWMSVCGDPTDRFFYLDQKISVIEGHIFDAVFNYVCHLSESAPQRLRNFKARQAMKLVNSCKNPKMRFYYEYINYKI